MYQNTLLHLMSVFAEGEDGACLQTNEGGGYVYSDQPQSSSEMKRQPPLQLLSTESLPLV